MTTDGTFELHAVGGGRPAMERVVTVDDHPVRYLSAGTGPELVLLHGSERARPTGRRSFPGWQRRGLDRPKADRGDRRPGGNHDVGLPTVCGRTGRVSITGW
jgi:hypothetical protein